MRFFTCLVCIALLTLDVTLAADQNCLCVTGSTKKIYTSPGVNREEIGLAIRGECLPVAHTNDENDAWVAVDFKKNIIFHQLHLIGYIVRDSSVVYRRCTGGQAIAFLTTTEPYISYSPTTESTSTEETITIAGTSQFNNNTSVTMETTLMSTLKPTSDVTSGELTTTIMTTIKDGTNVSSTTESINMPPTTGPDTMPPSKEPDTMPPTKEPDTMPPTKEPDTMPPTKTPVTTNELTSDTTATKAFSPTAATIMSTMAHVTKDVSSPMNHTSTEPVSSTSHMVNSRSTTASQITNEISSTPLPQTQSTVPKQNTSITSPEIITTSHGTPAATKPTDTYLTSDSLTTTDMYVPSTVTKVSDIPFTSDVTKGTLNVTKHTDATSSTPSHTADITTISGSYSTVISITNTTETSCDQKCLNGGLCVTDPFVSCLCIGGWTGASCDVCAGTTCDHGVCVMVGATPTCVCSPGFTGPSCNESHVCNSSESSIGGKCYTFNYVYETCQENYCLNQPGTECLVNSEGVYCLCKDEFNPTDSTPCGCPAGYVRHLNGTCVDIDCRGVSSCSHGSCYFRSFYNFGCLCDEGWEGEDCDMAVSQCGVHRCNNNGTCVRDPDAICHCTDAWTGAECDICGTQPCHHGVCILDRYQQPMCVCDKEYGGPQCDQVMQCSGQEFGGHCYGNDLENFTPCIENVCMSDQLCVAALHTFKNDLYCVCKENATEAYLTSDCGCPERSLRNYRGECVDILL